MPDLKRVISNSAQKAIMHEGKILKLPHAEEPYYKFLYHLALALRPEKIFELGVYQGTSLAHLAIGGVFSAVVGVDKDISQVDKLVKNMLKVRLVEADSIEYLKIFGDKSVTEALFHLDSLHTPEQVSEELKQVIRITVPPAVVCIDDIRIDDDMSDWWDSLELDKIEFPELHSTSYGVIILQGD